MHHIFISHAWKYNKDYNTIISWLNRKNISYKNYSVPEHDPLHVKSQQQLKLALTEQIKHASIVFIIAGMYVAYSDWIDYEIDEAVRMGKRIVALKPYGHEKLPRKIIEATNEIYNWSSVNLYYVLGEI